MCFVAFSGNGCTGRGERYAGILSNLAECMHWHSVGEVVAYGVDKKGDVRNTAYLEPSSGIRFSLNF